MVSNCANPECAMEFRYLHEGELFTIELPDRTVQHYWLCGVCAAHMRVVYDASMGTAVVAKFRTFAVA